jgi:hypothetical protein
MTENGVRRVVTGHSGERSAVAGDHLVEPVVVSALPGYSWHRIWSQDQPRHRNEHEHRNEQR